MKRGNLIFQGLMRKPFNLEIQGNLKPNPLEIQGFFCFIRLEIQGILKIYTSHSSYM